MDQRSWRRIRVDYLTAVEGRSGLGLALRGAWAQTMDGRWVALPAAEERNPDRWWLSYHQRAFEAKGAVGTILLCRCDDGGLLDFGLPSDLLTNLRARLSPEGNAVYLNVVKRGSRFELQVPGADPVDITSTLGDLSWLVPDADATAGRQADPAVAESVPPYAAAPREGVSAPGKAERFFAVFKDGALTPLDPVGLVEGDVCLVSACKAEAVPPTAAFRRILALGGPHDLPPDLAEQHDHYAHGAARR